MHTGGEGGKDGDTEPNSNDKGGTVYAVRKTYRHCRYEMWCIKTTLANDRRAMDGFDALVHDHCPSICAELARTLAVIRAHVVAHMRFLSVMVLGVKM